MITNKDIAPTNHMIFLHTNSPKIYKLPEVKIEFSKVGI